MFTDDNINRYVTLVERWALGLGIIAAGGAFAYLRVIGQTKVLGHWLIWPTTVVGVSVIWLGGVQFGRPLWAAPRSRKDWIALGLTWAALTLSGCVAVIAAAEWVDNQKRIELCKEPQNANNPRCIELHPSYEERESAARKHGRPVLEVAPGP